MTSPSMHWNSSEAVASPITGGAAQMPPHAVRTSGKVWIASDVFSVVVLAVLTSLYRLHAGPRQAATGLIHGTLISGSSLGLFLTYLAGFTAVLVLISQRLNLYNPMQLHSFLNEQRLSLHACFGSGLLMAGALYLLRAREIPRSIAVFTVVSVAACLGVRRFIYRIWVHRSLRRGVGARNVLIVGAGSCACAVRHHILDRRSYLGYRFQGFIQVPGAETAPAVNPGDIVGDLENVFDCARLRFVEEILLAAPNSLEGKTAWLLEGARAHGIGLRIVPDLYDGFAWQNPVEYIGQVPSIPIHCEEIPEFALFFKRGFDIVFSLLILVLLSPLFAALALAVKLDSPGPAFYIAERIGKKGRVFRCIKFRTMIQEAEQRLAEVIHMNERDGVLFKVSNDPRITPLGRLLRKYSLDELPQFFNVLRGEMSVVGPRPAIASEVTRYEIQHLRRLDVTPGITGLWQIKGRQDPSFTSYVSLDVSYIDNWSPWLDFKIILRTIGVVVAGTGF